MKKIYIKEDKIKLLKESNSPDQVIYNSEVLEFYDKDAYAFIVNEIDNKVIVTIAEDHGFPHFMIKNDMASKLMGFEGYSHFLKYIQNNEELYDDLYGEIESKVNDIYKTITYEGRYWRDNGIIVFWENTPSRNVLGEILKQLNNSLNISIDDTIVVIRDSFIPFRNYHFNDEINNEEFDGNSNVSDKDLRAIHLMNQQDKREALTDFRQNRAEVQGKKLGKMPMAQYHSLIYQEEKNVFNWGNYFSNLKRIDEIFKSKKNILKEHHAQQRLPFDDDFYSKKNVFEEFIDWLEEFGKVGELKGSSISFEDCIRKYFKKYIEIISDGSTILNTDLEIMEYFKKEYSYERHDNNDTKNVILCNDNGFWNGSFNNLKTKCKFDEKGNMYIERAVKLPKELNKHDNIMFDNLIKKYNNNVGACWCWNENFTTSYCSHKNMNTEIILCGYIRLDDIDWLTTFSQMDMPGQWFECEIRTKSNAKIELVKIKTNNFEYNFKQHIIVTSSYFGNNSNYGGEYANIENTFVYNNRLSKKGTYADYKKNKQIVNRQNEFINLNDYILNNFKNGEDIINVYHDYKLLSDKILLVINDELKYNILDSENNLKYEYWFENCVILNQNVFLSDDNDYFIILDLFGNEIRSYDDCVEDVTSVGNYDNFVISDNNGTYLMSSNGKILNDNKYALDVINHNNIIVYDENENVNFMNNINGELIFDDWFNSIDIINVNETNYYIVVFHDGTSNIIDDGYNFLLESNVDKIKYDNRKCRNYCLVKKGKMYNLVDFNGNYIIENWYTMSEIYDLFHSDKNNYFIKTIYNFI